MDAEVRKCLVRWNDRNDSVATAVQNLRFDEELLDVTLACDGHTIRAHKLVLAASSQYFRKVLKEHPCEHPTIVIDDLKWSQLLALLHFMYYGQVLVEEDSMGPLLVAASSLAITGLGHVTTALTFSQKSVDVQINPTNNQEKLTIENVSEAATERPLSNGFEPDKERSSTTPLDRRKNFSTLGPEVRPPHDIETSSHDKSEKETKHSIKLEKRLESAPKRQKVSTLLPSEDEEECQQRNEKPDPNMKENIENAYAMHRAPDAAEPNFSPEDLSVNKNRKKILQEVLHKQFIPIGKSASSIINGDSHHSKGAEEAEEEDKDLKEENLQDNGDSDDTGPSPLPLNHPAVVAAASSSAAMASAAAAAIAVAANGANIPGPLSAMNYAALMAGTRGVLSPNGDPSSVSAESLIPHMALRNGGLNNGSPMSTLPGNSSVYVWMPPTASASPSPSPPLSLTTNQQSHIHPADFAVQDMQATLEQYQRKLAFHEPRPCPTCKRMYRDAATLRTHTTIMHSEGKEPFTCSCGCLFRTKYDMYQHKKNGHRS